MGIINSKVMVFSLILLAGISSSLAYLSYEKFVEVDKQDKIEKIALAEHKRIHNNEIRINWGGKGDGMPPVKQRKSGVR